MMAAEVQPSTVAAEEEREPMIEKVPLWGSCRLIYTICATVSLFNCFLLRFSLSFALVCMVKFQPQNLTNTSSDPDTLCPTMLPSKDVYMGDLEWSKSLQEWILSGFFYGFLVSLIAGGWVSDRFGGKLLFVLGSLVQSLLALAIPAAARYNPAALFVLRILQGLVCGLYLPSHFQLFSKWSHPSERTRLMSFAYMGFPLALVIIYPLSSFLCQYGIDGGWPSIFYVTGFFGTACSLFFCSLVYDSPDKHPRISNLERSYITGNSLRVHKPLKPPLKSIFLSAPINANHVAHFCYSWGYITMATNLPLIMKEVLHFDVRQNGIYSSLPYIGSFFMRFIIAVGFAPIHKLTKLGLTNFRKINHTFGAVLAGVSLLFLTMLTCQQQYLAVSLITLSLVVADIAFTSGYACSFLELAPPYVGFLTGINNVFGSLAGVLSPTLVGLVTPNGTHEEWNIVLFVTAGFYFLGAVVYLIFGSSELQSWAVDEEKIPLLGDQEDMEDVRHKALLQ
uniref:Major facilitator superfamily (MFS) profile domain-containing protein n=1 Tax=Timema cristinae TaxID=61476 RepID=A0A7R9DHI7_TIMCR|nr:unnamed protein product [Timema cristinae]